MADPTSAEHWAAVVDPRSGRTYYVNHVTKETAWTLPDTIPMPPNWTSATDAQGRKYFVNHIQRRTTWTDPRLMKADGEGNASISTSDPSSAASSLLSTTPVKRDPSAPPLSHGKSETEIVANDTKPVRKTMKRNLLQSDKDADLSIGDVLFVKSNMRKRKAFVLAIEQLRPQDRRKYRLLVESGKEETTFLKKRHAHLVQNIGERVTTLLHLLRACVKNAFDSGNVVKVLDRVASSLAIETQGETSVDLAGFRALLTFRGGVGLVAETLNASLRREDKAAVAATVRSLVQCAQACPHIRKEKGGDAFANKFATSVDDAVVDGVLRCVASGSPREIQELGVKFVNLVTQMFGSDDASLVARFIRKGAVKVLIAALPGEGTTGADDDASPYGCMQCFASLVRSASSSAEGREALLESGTLRYIFKVLTTIPVANASFSTLFDVACSVLLPSDDDDDDDATRRTTAIKTLLESDDGVSALCSLLKRSLSSRSVCVRIIAILSLAADVDASSVVSGIVSGGAIQIIVRVVSGDAGEGVDALSTARALALLRHVAAGGGSAAAVFRSGAVNLSLRAAKQYFKSRETVRAAVVLVDALMKRCPLDASPSEVLGFEGTSTIVDVLTSGTAEDLRDACIRILLAALGASEGSESLSQGPLHAKICTRIVKGKVLDTLLDAASKRALKPSERSLLRALLLSDGSIDSVESPTLLTNAARCLIVDIDVTARIKSGNIGRVLVALRRALQRRNDTSLKSDDGAGSKIDPLNATEISKIAACLEIVPGSSSILFDILDAVRSLRDRIKADALRSIARVVSCESGDDGSAHTSSSKLRAMTLVHQIVYDAKFDDPKTMKEISTAIAIGMHQSDRKLMHAAMKTAVTLCQRGSAYRPFLTPRVIPILLKRLVASGEDEVSNESTARTDDAIVSACSVLTSCSESVAKSPDDSESAASIAIKEDVITPLLVLLEAPSESVVGAALAALIALSNASRDACVVMVRSSRMFITRLIPLLTWSEIAPKDGASSGDAARSKEHRKAAMQLMLLVCQETPELTKSLFDSLPGCLDRLISTAECSPELYANLMHRLSSTTTWSRIGACAAVNLTLALAHRPKVNAPAALEAAQKMCKEQPQIVVERILGAEKSRSDTSSAGLSRVVSLISSPQPKLSEAALLLAITCVTESRARTLMLDQLPDMVRLLSSYSIDVSSAALSLLERLSLSNASLFWDRTVKKGACASLTGKLVDLIARENRSRRRTVSDSSKNDDSDASALNRSKRMSHVTSLLLRRFECVSPSKDRARDPAAMEHAVAQLVEFGMHGSKVDRSFTVRCLSAMCRTDLSVSSLDQSASVIALREKLAPCLQLILPCVDEGDVLLRSEATKLLRILCTDCSKKQARCLLHFIMENDAEKTHGMDTLVSAIEAQSDDEEMSLETAIGCGQAVLTIAEVADTKMRGVLLTTGAVRALVRRAGILTWKKGVATTETKSTTAAKKKTKEENNANDADNSNDGGENENDQEEEEDESSMRRAPSGASKEASDDESKRSVSHDEILRQALRVVTIVAAVGTLRSRVVKDMPRLAECLLLRLKTETKPERSQNVPQIVAALERITVLSLEKSSTSKRVDVCSLLLRISESTLRPTTRLVTMRIIHDLCVNFADIRASVRDRVTRLVCANLKRSEDGEQNDVNETERACDDACLCLIVPIVTVGNVEGTKITDELGAAITSALAGVIRRFASTSWESQRQAAHAVETCYMMALQRSWRSHVSKSKILMESLRECGSRRAIAVLRTVGIDLDCDKFAKMPIRSTLSATFALATTADLAAKASSSNAPSRKTTVDENSDSRRDESADSLLPPAYVPPVVARAKHPAISTQRKQFDAPPPPPPSFHTSAAIGKRAEEGLDTKSAREKREDPPPPPPPVSSSATTTNVRPRWASQTQQKRSWGATTATMDGPSKTGRSAGSSKNTPASWASPSIDKEVKAHGAVSTTKWGSAKKEHRAQNGGWGSSSVASTRHQNTTSLSPPKLAAARTSDWTGTSSEDASSPNSASDAESRGRKPEDTNARVWGRPVRHVAKPPRGVSSTQGARPATSSLRGVSPNTNAAAPGAPRWGVPPARPSAQTMTTPTTTPRVPIRPPRGMPRAHHPRPQTMFGTLPTATGAPRPHPHHSSAHFYRPQQQHRPPPARFDVNASSSASRLEPRRDVVRTSIPVRTSSPSVRRQDSMAETDKIAAVKAMTGCAESRCRDALVKTAWDVAKAAEQVLESSRSVTSSSSATKRRDSLREPDTPTQSTTAESSGVNEIEGFLFKRSNFWKTWRKRYVSLQQGHILSYVDDSAAQSNGDKPKDAFKLGPQSVVTTSSERAYAFAVTLENGKELLLAADSASVAELWMKAVRGAVETIKREMPSISTGSVPKAKQLSAEEEAELVKKLEGMGFTAAQAHAALEQSGGHVDRAVELLLSGDVSAAATKAAPSSSSAAASSSKEQSDIERAIQASLREAERLARGSGNGSSRRPPGENDSFADAGTKERMMEVKIPYDAIPGRPMRVVAPNGRSYEVMIPSPIPASRKIHLAYE